VAGKTSTSERGAAELIERMARSMYADGFVEGLNPAQWSALRYISCANRFSRTVCAFALFHGTTRGPASQTIKALVEKGYFRRRPEKRDRRSFRLDLTAKARRVLAYDPIQDLVNSIGALSSEQRPALAEGLQVMHEHLLTARGRRLFGTCGSCRHLRRDGCRLGPGARCECGFNGELLSEEELADFCVNFESHTVPDG